MKNKSVIVRTTWKYFDIITQYLSDREQFTKVQGNK